jgi:hypothetical protein
LNDTFPRGARGGIILETRAVSTHPPLPCPADPVTTDPAVSAAPAPAEASHPAPGLDPALLRAEWEGALSFERFAAATVELHDLWGRLYERSAVPEAWAERVRRLPEPLRLLVMSEDWCGDSVNTVPLLQRLAEASGGTLELRVTGRDDHPELMDAHLTGTSRSIPVVIVLDADFRERAWWGSRPAPLQKWVLETGLALPKEDRYREVRLWYVRDRGATTLAELVPLLERAAAPA